MESTPIVTERVEKMLRLVELDYNQTSEFVRGVLGTATTVRGWAITIWLALVGFSVQQDEWVLSALGVVIAAGFYVIDAYHMNLYRQGLAHLQALERLYAEYYGALARGNFYPDALSDFVIDLETHRFGFFRRIGPFRLGQSIRRGPRVFVSLYAVMIVVSALLAVVEAATSFGV